MTIADLAAEDVATLYAYPLFSQYDLEVELERRLRLLKDEVAQIAPFYFSDHHVENLCNHGAPAALGLGAIRKLDRKEHGGKDGWAFLVEFAGDPELWKLSPATDIAAPDGEIIRNELLMVYHEGEEEARAHFERELSAIEDIIELQSNRILAFALTLPARVQQMHFDRLTNAQGAFAERLPRTESHRVIACYEEGAT